MIDPATGARASSAFAWLRYLGAAALLSASSLAAARTTQQTVCTQAHELLRAAVERCDWREAEVHATLALGACAHGSDGWFEAIAAVARARYTLASPFGSRELTTEALELAARLESEVGAPPLSVRAQGALTEIEICAAAELQRHGDHALALTHLRRANARLRDGRAADAYHLLPETLLARARSMAVLGYEDQGRPLLLELRDRFEGTLEAAIASVLLQQGPSGMAAYRGRYQDDEELLERARSLQALLPGVGTEVARTFGVDERLLEPVRVGLVDRLDNHKGFAAVTLVDPRQPDFPPVVVVFSQPLALGLLDPREMLVHELGHAALSLELGLAHEALPGWLIEGAVQAVAAPWEELADEILAARMVVDPGAFIAPDFRVQALLDLCETPCERGSSRALGLGLWPMERGIRERGWLGLVPALRQHASVDIALNEAFGHAPPPRSWLEREIAQRLAARRAAALPDLEALVRAHAQGPSHGLSCAERILRPGGSGAPAPLARGFALWDRAGALEALGRLEEAEAAFAELCGPRAPQSAYIESARQARLRCLLKLGREAQAERELMALERDALNPTISAWASQYLREVRAVRGK